MPVTFRKAAASDIDAVTAIYDAIHTEEEAGRAATGWKRGIYPVRATAEAALTRGDLFVAEADGRVAAAAVLNQIQVDVYAGAPWEFEASDEEIFVMHTLVVDPAAVVREIGVGLQQRVEILKTLYRGADILILDEPLSGVDVEGMETLMDMLDEIRKNYDLSILMTTHDFSLLPRYADQVVLIDHGVLIQGDPQAVLDSEEFHRTFHMRGGRA